MSAGLVFALFVPSALAHNFLNPVLSLVHFDVSSLAVYKPLWMFLVVGAAWCLFHYSFFNFKLYFCLCCIFQIGFGVFVAMSGIYVVFILMTMSAIKEIKE